MKCARCSAELPAQSQFCLRCGTAVQRTPVAQTAAFPPPAAPTMAYNAAAPAPRANNRPMLIVVGILVLAVLALGGVVVKGLLTKNAGSDGSKLVQAPGNSNSGSLVQAPGDAHPNTMVQAPADARPTKVTQAPNEAAPFPADIDDYLKFVKHIEEKKLGLTKDVTAKMLVIQAGSLGQQAEAAQDDDKAKQYLPNLGKDLNDMAPQWEDLTREFNSRTPPPSCRDLYAKYYDYLGKVQGQFVSIGNAISQAQSNPSEALRVLTHMQGSASLEADRAAQLADDALASICNQYHLTKNFDIRTDPSAGTSLFR